MKDPDASLESTQGREELAKFIEAMGNVSINLVDWKENILPLGRGFAYSLANLIRGKENWINDFGEKVIKLFDSSPDSRAFAQSEQGQDLFSYVAKNIRPEMTFRRLNAIGSVYLNTLAKYEQDGHEQLSARALLYITQIEQLGNDDLMALRAAHDLYKIGYNSDELQNSEGNWRSKIAAHLGYDSGDALVGTIERLESSGLIHKRTYHDKSGLNIGQEMGLTAYGIGLCRFAFDEPEKLSL